MKAATSSTQSRGKRSPDALREPRPRKREKYAKMACSLCKVRKVKCSGNQPCSRCEELHSQCTYNEPFQPEAADFDSQPAIRDPEVAVQRMNRICHQMQQSIGRFGLAPSHRSSCLQRRQENDELPQPNKPLTPTDPGHTLSLTQDAMRERGLLSPPHSEDGPHPVNQDELKFPDALINTLQAARPLLELGHAKVTRLFTIFRDEVYPFYPCVSLDLGRNAINAVFSLFKNTSHVVIINVDMIDVEITKAVVAIALLLRDDTGSSLTSDLEGQLIWSIESCFDQEKPQIEDIVIAILLEPQESYISTMISLDRNLSETWTVVNAPSPQTKNSEERAEFLNFQLQKLLDKIPTGDFENLDPTVAPPPWLQAGLKQFSHLRVHHIGILTQISASGSIRDLMSNPISTNTLVTAAAKSVDLHLEMINTGEKSPLVLPTMIKLLLTSLSIMMFAVSHRPEEYGSICSKPFQTAIQILSDVKSYVKDPDLNVWGTLHILEKVVEASQRSRSQSSAPLISRKEDVGNDIDRGEHFEVNMFEELPTPDSEFFSMLGSMVATDILHMDNVFG
ncbi:uncharacterized protein N7496_011834 [Penicillium cataractarum]|uniref:Zn(2)-C6 fungal-type domain-containing protein n=1 Tax=Penicillium cataractarum TaxID=2100454 RepID=A0A9W9RG07_9EURO|nr:uncharacterized protein N7496_011834 [Penicillium cataractarum]KAJ5359421.1 hypothetical protein N7496_011834 [Penicillium cataractarum]